MKKKDILTLVALGFLWALVFACYIGKAVSAAKPVVQIGSETVSVPQDKTASQTVWQQETTAQQGEKKESVATKEDKTNKKKAQKKKTKKKETAVSVQKWNETTILKKVHAAINRLETSTESLQLSEVKTLSLNLDACSDSSMKTAVNSLIKSFDFEREMTYSFKNAIATDATGATVQPLDILPPVHGKFDLKKADLSYAKAQQVGDHTILIIKVNSETVERGMTPPIHAVSTGFLDFSAMDFGEMSVSQMVITYERSTLSVTVDKNNEFISLTGILPFKVHADVSFGKNFTVDVSGKLVFTEKKIK